MASSITPPNTIKTTINQPPVIKTTINQPPAIKSKLVIGQGPAGISAYEVAVKNGFIGTELDWLVSIGAELTWASTNW